MSLRVYHAAQTLFLSPDPFTSTNVRDWSLKLGDYHLLKKEHYEQPREMINITIHPKYKSMWFEGIYDTPPQNDVGMYHVHVGSTRHPLFPFIFTSYTNIHTHTHIYIQTQT